ncbi:MLO-like protein 12 [Bidens hawaiensis]|uniref:MLO-like protein 12 n=1 Tax=Bidens hawaiensis TaxID=980011 RepID=UPI00404AA8C3
MANKVELLKKTKERSLKITPSWAVAVVVFVILAISIALEYILHLTGHWLQHKHKKSLHEALEKIKAELMLLGFISLLLTVGQEPISKICISSEVARTWHPCNDDSKDTDFYDPCLKKGKVQMVSNYGIHQLHIFLFVLAVVHVTYCLLTLVLGKLKMRRWKAWEDETRTVEYQYHHDPERFRFARETTFGRRHLKAWSTSTILLWIGCFFRQFFSSVTKVDYLTLRHGFINTHLTPESQLDFHKYITKSLEEDFKEVVGISPIVWFFAVLLLLTNTHDWYAYLWLPFIPLVVILVVGTKLQVIITKMGRRTHEMADVVKGTPVVEPTDDLFWFGRPQLVLLLINFVLFQNAFQLAFLWWSWDTFGIGTCFHHRTEDIVIRFTMGVVIQFLCSYVTLPLYALVTQMGSRMKPTIFGDNVAKGLEKWHHTAIHNIKHGHSSTNTPFSSRPGTPLHGSTSPLHLLHRHPDNSVDSPPESPRGEGWANESSLNEPDNFRRDNRTDVEEGEIQEIDLGSNRFPTGPRPVRSQSAVAMSEFSFGYGK